jgi:hypothetical protein
LEEDKMSSVIEKVDVVARGVAFVP